MTIIHHADDSTLMSYSAGTLGEALSAVVASHLAVCPHCRTELAAMDRLGGLMLASLPGSAIKLAPPRAAAPACEHKPPAASAAVDGGPVPAPLTRLIGNDLNAVPWKRLSVGVWHSRLPLSEGAKGDLRLIKIAAGQMMPDHGHGGSELTLVLEGSYTDGLGRFGAGDIADLDQDVDHQPVADQDTGCICLIASEEKARFKSIMARIAQPFIGL